MGGRGPAPAGHEEGSAEGLVDLLRQQLSQFSQLLKDPLGLVGSDILVQLLELTLHLLDDCVGTSGLAVELQEVYPSTRLDTEDGHTHRRLNERIHEGATPRQSSEVATAIVHRMHRHAVSLRRVRRRVGRVLQLRTAIGLLDVGPPVVAPLGGVLGGLDPVKSPVVV